MTTKVDGLSWTAIGVIAGIALPIIALIVGMIWRVDSRVERLQDETHREFIAVRADIADIKTDMSAMKTEMADIKTDMSAMKTEMADIKTEMADMKTDVAGLKTDMEVVIALLERVERGQSAGSIPAKPSAQPAKPGSPGQPEARRGHRPIGNPANDTASK